MKKSLTALIIFLFAEASFAQNLISNPGFETYSGLPSGSAQYYLATGWDNCDGSGSPDYFSNLGSGIVQLPNCFIGTLSPYSGDGCMGAAFYYYSPPNFREYLSTQLISPLVPGTTYNVSMYVSNGITSGTYGGGGIDKICAAFSMQPLTQPGMDPIPVTPQVTYGTIYYSHTWQLITMQFVADSAYQYVTFGNFFPDASTAFQQFDPCSNFGAYYFFDDVEVSVANVAPVAVFSAPNHICPGTCTDFNNLSLNATSFQWSFPGATPAVSVDANPIGICYNAPGNYSVELIATNSVSSDTLTLANYITVYPFPQAQGILQSGDSLIANQGAVSYQWYQDGNLVPGATDYFYVAAQSGNYNVVATDANGCEVEAVIFDVVASIESNKEIHQPLLYPNPVTSHLTITYPSSISEGFISVCNSYGARIITSRLQQKNIIDCTDFSAGIYFVELNDGNNISRYRFIKQ